MPFPTPAERLDAAISSLLDGGPAHDGGLLRTAGLLQAALPPLPPGVAFEKRLAQRLGDPGLAQRLRRRAAAARRELTPSRLLAAGAVSSAAVGFTALAMWRGGRRHAGGHR